MLLAVSLSACSWFHHDYGGSKPGPTYIIYSPNGEPLNGGPLGSPTCEEAMTRWFDRVDVHHDGKMNHDEFVADASAQFQRMDIDKNGYLLPEELERYRQPYRQDSIADMAKSSFADAEDGDDQTQHHRGHYGASGVNSHSDGGSAQGGLVPDPVMSADTNNDFRVTLQEFMTQAEHGFGNLDVNHSGLISRDELLKAFCKPKDKNR